MTHRNATLSRLQRARVLADEAEAMRGGEMAQTKAALSTMHSALVLAELAVDFSEPHAVLVPPKRAWWRFW